jgi:hypothetical protein
MARLNTTQITHTDIAEYLATSSDFAFELSVLKQLSDLGFECEHGGTYSDPVTKKDRAFDIRATKRFGHYCFLRLAVECKNVRDNFPLLVHCVPRIDAESFHSVCLAVEPSRHPLERPQSLDIPAYRARCENIAFRRDSSIYRPHKPTGKACVQVGRSEKGDIVSTDSDLYDKWSQALASADDLIHQSAFAAESHTKQYAVSLVFPLLVLPQDRLWTVQHDAEGNLTSGPTQTDRCSYYVNKTYYPEGSNCQNPYAISHIDFLTTTGLTSFVQGLTGTEDATRALFAIDYCRQRLKIATRNDGG